MAITTFIPEVWAAQLLSKLQKDLVFGGPDVVNRNYEGEIAEFGDTVHITQIGDPAIGNYTKDADLPAIQALTDSEQLLTIDQQKVFNFAVDDIDVRQARAGGALMAEAAARTAYNLRDLVDNFLASKMAAGAQASNAVGSVALSLATDAYDKVLVPLSQKLDEANVPEEGRFVVVAPSLYARLLLDGRFIKVNESGSQEGLRNGNVGNALGFTILKSNNAPAGSRVVTDGVTVVGTTVTSATAAFTSADVNKVITGTGVAAGAFIVSVQSATSVTMSANGTAGTAATLTIGSANSRLALAGSNIATTYAQQINKVEAYRPQQRFSDALKGLLLYGAKVIRPEALAVASVL